MGTKSAADRKGVGDKPPPSQKSPLPRIAKLGSAVRMSGDHLTVNKVDSAGTPFTPGRTGSFC